MEFKYFSRNGEVLPIAEATVPLSSVEYSYGFGVYETIRVNGGVPLFLSDHMERLLSSAEVIELKHSFTTESVSSSFTELLIAKNEADTCNVKILLVGGRTKEDATLYILCLNPLFPDKKLYRDGAVCITVEYERILPHAKTLNMLGSYLAYRKAKEAGAYDALLLDRDGNVVEGTRTNFFCISAQGRSASGGKGTIISPPSDKILLGVTRKHVLDVASRAGFSLEERDIPLEDVFTQDGAFITSTSTKIMPIQSIDGRALPAIPPALRELMAEFDRFTDAATL